MKRSYQDYMGVEDSEEITYIKSDVENKKDEIFREKLRKKEKEDKKKLYAKLTKEEINIIELPWGRFEEIEKILEKHNWQVILIFNKRGIINE